MSPELTFWDHVTIVVALVFIAIYSGIKIRHMLKPSSGGCGGCSGSGCGVPDQNTPNNNTKASSHSVSLASIETRPNMNVRYDN